MAIAEGFDAMTKAKSERIWIGVAEVLPRPDDEMFEDKHAGGGFINIIALAKCEHEFLSTAKEAIQEYGVQFVTLRNSRLFEDVLKEKEVDPLIVEAAERLKIGQDKVGFGTLHTYPPDDR